MTLQVYEQGNITIVLRYLGAARGYAVNVKHGDLRVEYSYRSVDRALQAFHAECGRAQALVG